MLLNVNFDAGIRGETGRGHGAGVPHAIGTDGRYSTGDHATTHSSRIASVGSSRDALTAGTAVANAETRAKPADAKRRLAGSPGVIPKRSVLATLVAATASTAPSMMPTVTSTHASRPIRAMMAARSAPSAMRMPISVRRLATV